MAAINGSRAVRQASAGSREPSENHRHPSFGADFACTIQDTTLMDVRIVEIDNPSVVTRFPIHQCSCIGLH